MTFSVREPRRQLWKDSRVMSNPNFHTTGADYLNADTTAFMQLIQGDLFAEFPSNRSCGHSAALGEPVWAAPGPRINRWVDVGINGVDFSKRLSGRWQHFLKVDDREAPIKRRSK